MGTRRQGPFGKKPAHWGTHTPCLYTLQAAQVKVLFPVFYSITRKPPLCCRGLRLVYLEITEADPVSTSSIV
jgi:hypothetical protein